MRHWKVGPGTKIGIGGFGGLGYMATKIVLALGAEVTLVSSSNDKLPDAQKIRAHHVVNSKDEVKELVS